MLALEQALEIISTQETWSNQDDLCDCTYQRAGYWNNPYIGETYEVRICCLYAEFEKMWPQYFKRTQIEAAHWNGEDDMPASIWYRQIAKGAGVPVSLARKIADGLTPPKGTPRTPKPLFYLKWGSDYVPMELGR